MNLNLSAAAPEIVLLCALFGVLLADLWTSDENRYITHYLSIGSMLAAAFTQIAVWTGQPAQAFNGFYLVDGVSQLAKLTVYLGTAALFVYAKPYNKAQKMFKGEYYTLAMFAATGMSVMISSAHFLTAYIGLELLSLSLYAMIALRRDSVQASEAALKYFVLGALASGILLYGISMVYGAAGSLHFAAVAQAAADGHVNGWLLKLGILFIVAAIAFKFGAVPFHMWVPDVYQGAPTSVAAFIGSMPKIAATVFTFRILVEGFALQKGDWQLVFAALGALSLLVGNLAAIMQTNIKRMFAFSTVSHMGFILLAFLGSVIGVEAAVYYAVAYPDELGGLWRADGGEPRRQRMRKHCRLGRFEPAQCLVCLRDAAGAVQHGRHSAADGFLCEIRRAQSPGSGAIRLGALAGGVCRGDVAHRRVLLSARGTDDVF